MKVSHDLFKFITVDGYVSNLSFEGGRSLEKASRAVPVPRVAQTSRLLRCLRTTSQTCPTPACLRQPTVVSIKAQPPGGLGCRPHSPRRVFIKYHSAILLIGMLVILFAASSITAEEVSQVPLSSVKVIYLMPMRDRMDHYLTAELVQWGQYQVTINPHLADAILSDVPQIDLKGLREDPPRIARSSKASRGNVFLIDPKSEKLIWSTSKDTSTSYLVHTSYKSVKDLAHEIIGQMRQDVSKQK